MPERKTIERAREDARKGKSPSTQAGEFVREEIHHVREGKHGVRNPKQAIAIGLSKARRAGVKIPNRGESRNVRSENATTRELSRTRSRATRRTLKREGKSGASRQALSSQARTAARRRGSANRRAAARKAARTRQHSGGKQTRRPSR